MSLCVMDALPKPESGLAVEFRRMSDAGLLLEDVSSDDFESLRANGGVLSSSLENISSSLSLTVNRETQMRSRRSRTFLLIVKLNPTPD